MINLQKQSYLWLSLYEDLFGDWCLRIISGRLHDKPQRRASKHYPTKILASQALTDLEATKRNLGYTYAAIPSITHFDLTPQTIAEVRALNPKSNLNYA